MMKMYQTSAGEEPESEKQMRQFEEEDLLSRNINVHRHHLLSYLKTMKSIPRFLTGNVYGKNKFVRYVLSFVHRRSEMQGLVEAMQSLVYDDSPIPYLFHFTELLSCLKTMILFDTYEGNQVSSEKIFGGVWERGYIHHFLDINQIKASAILGHKTVSQMLDASDLHLDYAKQQLLVLRKKIFADDNGRSFAIMNVGALGKSVLYNQFSNYNRGTEYMRFKRLHGGYFPSNKDEWIVFIQEVVIPSTVNKLRAVRQFCPLTRVVKCVNFYDDGDDEETTDYDVSIAKIKDEVMKK
jgi:hypothetical protein